MRIEKRLVVLGAAAALPIIVAACQINVGGPGAQSPGALGADAAVPDPDAATAPVPVGTTRQVQRIDRTPRPVDADAGAAPTPTTPLPVLDAGMPFDAAGLSLDAAAAFIKR